MHERYHKYFWDGKDGWPSHYQLRRIIEYASFPDLIKYPFGEVKLHIDKLNLEKLWTGEKRKQFMIFLKPYIYKSDSWEEAIRKMIDEAMNKRIEEGLL